MRRALLAALVLSLALTAPAQAAPGRASLTLPHGLVDQEGVTAGGLWFRTDIGRRQVVQRLDLTTLQEVTAYRVNRPYTVNELKAGGGRVALQVDDEGPRGGFLSRVIELTPAGPRTLLRGVYRNRRGADCGRQVKVEDMSQDGALLTSTTAYRCRGRRRVTHLLERFGPAGRTASLRAERWLASDPTWRLAGDQLLVATEKDVRVRNLATHATRRIRLNRARNLFGFADVERGGAAVVEQSRFQRRSFSTLIRLLVPGDPPTGGRPLFEAANIESQPRFCGARLVEHRTLRDRHELWVYDDLAALPRLVFSVPGRHRSARLECDADSAVIVEPRGARRTAVEVVPLAG